MCFKTYWKFPESISTEVPYRNLKCLFKTPKVASIVEFLSSEAGANGFSTE